MWRQPERIKRFFDVLTGLFERVGLQTNTAKTVRMVYRPWHAPGALLEKAYKIRMTGKGPMFWERQRRRLELP